MRYRAWDDEGRELVFVDGRCRRLTGYSAEEILSGAVQSLSDLIHPEDRNLVASEVRKALERGRTYRINYRIRTNRGTWRWVSDRGGRAGAEGGALVEGVLIDISARVSAELAKVRLEEKYNLLLQNVDDLIGVHDADGRFEYATPSSAKLIGYEPNELYKKSIYPLIHPDDRQRVRARIEERVRQDCEPVVIRHRLRTKEGPYVTVETQCKPVQDRDGYYSRFVTVSRDVTELTHLKRNVEDLQRQAAQAGGMDEKFLANMSREFRTPLSSIVGFAELLAEEVAEGQRSALRMIKESGEDILSTLTSVMEFSSAATKAATCQPRRIDIVPPVRAEVERYREPAHEEGVTVQFVPESERVFAVADPEIVSRVVDALLSNAVKFTAEGGVVTVAVLDEQDDEHVAVRVTDTGVGISEGFLPHVFEPFRKEETAAKTEGAGVGLALVKRLVEASHGSIGVESRKGGGSVFTARLPRAGKARGVGTTRLFEQISVPDDAALERHGRILALDDNDPMRLILARHLGKFFEVDLAGDADAAVELAGRHTYDAVLLDINLGTKKSGIDVLKDMKCLAGYDNTFFIAVTAYALPEEKSRFLKAGFDGLVSKPFTRESLLKEISRVTMLNLELDPNLRRN